MTTPERLRRRQRIEGAALLVLGIFVAAQSVYFDNRDEENDRCMATQFHELSMILAKRAELTQRESNATAKVLTTAATAKKPEQIKRALTEYEREVAQVYKERRENPLPEFPTGRCEKGGNSILSHQGFAGIGGLPADTRSRLADLEPRPDAGSPSPIRGASAGAPRSGERQQDSTGRRPTDRPTGGDRPSGGLDGVGGGGGVADGGTAVESAVDAVVGKVHEAVSTAADKTLEVLTDPRIQVVD